MFYWSLLMIFAMASASGWLEKTAVKAMNDGDDDKRRRQWWIATIFEEHKNTYEKEMKTLKEKRLSEIAEN